MVIPNAATNYAEISLATMRHLCTLEYIIPKCKGAAGRPTPGRIPSGSAFVSHELFPADQIDKDSNSAHSHQHFLQTAPYYGPVQGLADNSGGQTTKKYQNQERCVIFIENKTHT